MDEPSSLLGIGRVSCILKTVKVPGDRDTVPHLGAEGHDSLLAAENRTRVPAWMCEQMECGFLLRAWRESETWDNGPQLIHCTLKTHYSLKRNQKKPAPWDGKKNGAWGEDLGENSLFLLMCEISFMQSSVDLTRCLYWCGALQEPGGGHPPPPLL